MNIIKNHNGNIKIQSHDSLNYMSFMYKAVNIYTIISNAERLTDKELMWFCCFVYITNLDIKKYLSGDALQIYKDLTGVVPTKANISNYLKRIKDKGWIRDTNNEIAIPDFFRNIVIGDQVVDFEIRLYNEKEQTDEVS